MKTILVELTEKELNLLQNALIKEKYYWGDNKESDSSVIEDKTTLCNRIWSKLDSAHIAPPDALISIKDLFYMISTAKDQYCKLPSDLNISNKKVDEGDFKHISLANSVLVWLNSNNLLKRLVRFDYTDKSSQYEEME